MTNSIEISYVYQMEFLRFVAKRTTLKDVESCGITIGNNDLATVTPGCGTFKCVYNGETYGVSRKEEGQPLGELPKYFVRLCVEHDDMELLKSFVTAALTYKEEVEKNKIRVYTGTSKGYWPSYVTTYAQSLENIFISDGVKSSIIKDIDAFVDNKQRYIDFGRSHKLAFLLTGVPGSGKSSLVKAIANRYDRSVYALTFTKGMTDESFMDLIGDIKDNSVLLIEDIDAFFFERKAQDINISFSALLNVLDGVLSFSNGTLIFMTANNPDRLDPALIRAGRVDRILKFDYPKKKEIAAAFTKLTDGRDDFDEVYKHIHGMKMPMSAFIDFIFRHPKDYLACIEELVDQTKLYNEIVNDKTDKLYA